MACIVVAYVVMAFIVPAYTVMAYIVMAYTVMASTVMAYTQACIVMVVNPRELRQATQRRSQQYCVGLLLQHLC